MKLHANAALSWTGRRRLCELVVDEGLTIVAAAAAVGVSVRCARKWVGRYRLEGGVGKRWRGGVRPHYTPKRRDAAGVDRKTVGWEFVHVAVDDYSRLAYAEVLSDEKAATVAAFLTRAAAFYRRHGIRIERLL